jgi:AAA+ superfamily predicted ATPase
VTRTATSTAARRRDEIVSSLTRLDRRLDVALAAFDAAQGGPTLDRFRGLVISAQDTRRLLGRVPGSPMFAHPDTSDAREPLWPSARGTLARHLARTFRLSPFELDVLLIAFAPEFDLRYERIYAYLQDDVTRKRPTVDLVLNLLCEGDAERLSRRAAFDETAPLLRHELVAIGADAQHPSAPILARSVVPDDHVIRLLLGQTGLDDVLARVCRLEKPGTRLDELALPHEIRNRLAAIAGSARTRPPATLWFTAPHGAGKQDAAAAIACAARMPLLVLDAIKVAAPDVDTVLRRAMRDAACRVAILYVDRVESWLGDGNSGRLLADVLREPLCPLVLGSTQPMPPAVRGLAVSLTLPLPDRAGSMACWSLALDAHGVAVEPHTLSALADRFRLTPGQVSSAVNDAVQRAKWHATTLDLFAAARAQSSDTLGAVASKVDPRADWDDIVLPVDAIAQLRELCERVDRRGRVFDDWGFGRKLSRGRGTAALFSGGSGTGKTMAAEVVARTLGLDLYRIDLARVVSKYIGETEKNLDRVFTAAEAANAILFFDEADALFGKRSDVNDAHDRYANIEVSYLLQKMEDYDGLAILATNLADHLDPAFTRRLAAHIYFPFPDAAARLQIWQRAWPGEVPIAEDVDLAAIARDLKVAGGSIKNIALTAAFSAVGNGGRVSRAHLFHAVRREQQKSGRASELAPGFGELVAAPLAGAGER